MRGTNPAAGAHRRFVKPSADRPLPGMARLAGEFLDRLGLSDATLVGNDSGGAITQTLISGAAPWVGRAVLASCEALGNFPPGRPLRFLELGSASVDSDPTPATTWDYGPLAADSRAS